MVKSLNILGVSGSIGLSTMKVVLAQPDDFDVQIVSAYKSVDILAERAKALRAKVAVIGDEALLPVLERALDGTAIKASCDLLGALSAQRVDVTMAAIVGMAGLEPLIRAIDHSAAVVIANKEPLVAAGEQVLAAARKAGCTLLPADSEHNAIYQVFDQAQRSAIERIILTASGGAFFGWSRAQMQDVTPAQATTHPNWDMGAKITVDSATMMNKGLEVIEAAILFDMPPERIEVLIHPQSIVHSMVEYHDGSVLSQMGASDMCTPIANVLFGGAERLKTPSGRLDLTQLKALEFFKADFEIYPALQLAYDALRRGQSARIAYNAANEIAVAAFLDGQIAFLDIVDIVGEAVAKAPPAQLSTVENVIAYDKARREDAKLYIKNCDLN